MSWLKVSIVLLAVIVLAGPISPAVSQDASPPRDREGLDHARVPPGAAEGAPADARRPRPRRGAEAVPPPASRADDGDDQPQLPPGGPRRHPGPPVEEREMGPPPEGPGGPDAMGPPPRRGPQGDRPLPPGPPPRLPQRGREDLESLRTSDPELFKAMQEDRDLERQSRDQAQQYRRADKDEQAKIKEKLVEIVNKHFEVRQQLRSLEVKRLEQQLKQLRDKIDQRAKDRKDIVEKRIVELTGADEEHF